MTATWIAWVSNVLAAAEADPAQPAGGNQAQSPGFGSMLPFIAGIMILFYFIMLRPENKRRSQQKSMIEALKKNDRVLTVGGVYGVVANVQKDSDRVTLKIDETTGAKMDISFSAIARVLSDDAKSEKD